MLWFFVVVFYLEACGILVPWTRELNPLPPVLESEVSSLYHQGSPH